MEATTVTYVGMDVHARTIEYSIRRAGEQEVLRMQSEHAEAGVRGVFRKLRKQVRGPIRACYEAGPTGFGLHRLLTADGIDCAVVAPSLTPQRSGDRCKTDRKDARMLRELDEAGLLVEVHVPTRAEEAARSLTRKQESARHAITKAKLELGSMLLRLSIVRPTVKAWTKAHRQWLAELRLEQPSDQLVLEDCLLELEHCEQRLARLQAHVEDLAGTEPFAAKVASLRCFKGIDTATAMGIATELVSPERFRGARQVMSYAGLGIFEHSSGETRQRGGITKSGNHHLRRLLVRAARHAAQAVGRESESLKARRKQGSDWAAELGRRAERRLHAKYLRLIDRSKNPNVVVTAVAREMAGWVWASMMHDIRTGAVPPREVDADGVPVQ